MKRFRWSRKTYKHAAQLSRLSGIYGSEDAFPPPLKAYLRLWAEYENEHWKDDPFKAPLRMRLAEFKNPDDFIPF